jgi:hypothetical protein
MSTRSTSLLLAAISVSFLAAAQSPSEPTLLLIRVVEGEGDLHPCGGRSARPLAVQILDETGKPVANASVSFRLPEEGSSGTFASGLKTEVLSTAADGRAAVWGMVWNRTPGRVEVRITASRGQARAGTIAAVYLSDKVPSRPESRLRSGGHRKLLVALVAAGLGAAAGGVVLARGGTSGTSSAVTAGAVTDSFQIGTPSITIGKP